MINDDRPEVASSASGADNREGDLALWAASLKDALAGHSSRCSHFLQVARGQAPYDHPAIEEHAAVPFANAAAAASLMIFEIYKALNELPAFKHDPVLAPLHTLILAIQELPVGGRPDLLKGMSGKPGPQLSLTKAHVMGTAVTYWRLLRSAGLQVMPAAEEVARLFDRYGVKGRHRGKLSAKTIYDWTAGSGILDPIVQARSYSAADAVLQEHGGALTLSQARSWIEQNISDPVTHTKF